MVKKKYSFVRARERASGVSKKRWESDGREGRARRACTFRATPRRSSDERMRTSIERREGSRRGVRVVDYTSSGTRSGARRARARG